MLRNYYLSFDLQGIVGKGRYFVSKNREMPHRFIFAEIFQFSKKFPALITHAQDKIEDKYQLKTKG